MIMTIGPLPNAMEPEIHGVRTIALDPGFSWRSDWLRPA